MNARLRAAWIWLRELGRLIVGVPSYEAYVTHMRAQHPGATPMTYEQFF
ncbi:MAG TPA: CstA-like transporter-associated (seleno)protein, partial [Rhodanobacteraceae bacterium]|nr:CstA-like transporter-associated (seleno)protein [Rhodanobacteraceae bacterium]